MTDEQRAELKRLAEAYARNNMRRNAEGLPPTLVGVDPAVVLDLLKENAALAAHADQLMKDGNEAVNGAGGWRDVMTVETALKVRAEMERDALKAEVEALKLHITELEQELTHGDDL
jgi:hypothetical protein